MEISKVKDYIFEQFDKLMIPTLQEYIKIPNQSPDFDPKWETNGYAQQATDLIVDYIKKLDIKGCKVSVLKDPGRTHCIYAEIDSSLKSAHPNSLLFYAHYDKQPPMDVQKWTVTGPYEPKIVDGKLYGRGSSDDGYGSLAIALAIKALQVAGIEHGRLILAFESSEESGDEDIYHYLTKMQKEIGKLDLIVCMDSGCGDYKHLWNTGSLRGVMNFQLCVKYLKEGVHSGQNGGIVADTFNICRILLDRLEDPKTGILKDFTVKVSDERISQLKKAANVIGDTVHTKMPFITSAKHLGEKSDNFELLLTNTWKPCLAVTGCRGIPEIQKAGNVLRPETILKVSIRLPPTMNPKKAEDIMKAAILTDPPFGAQVCVKNVSLGIGFDAPTYPKWLNDSINASSQEFYKDDALFIGEGGSIPLMGMLAKRYEGVPFWVTGVLGPSTNAHSVNEMLPLEFTKNMVCTISKVIGDHAIQFNH